MGYEDWKETKKSRVSDKSTDENKVSVVKNLSGIIKLSSNAVAMLRFFNAMVSIVIAGIYFLLVPKAMALYAQAEPGLSTFGWFITWIGVLIISIPLLLNCLVLLILAFDRDVNSFKDALR